MPPLAYVVIGATWQVAPILVLACYRAQMRRLTDVWATPLDKRNDAGALTS